MQVEGINVRVIDRKYFLFVNGVVIFNTIRREYAMDCFISLSYELKQNKEK